MSFNKDTGIHTSAFYNPHYNLFNHSKHICLQQAISYDEKYVICYTYFICEQVNLWLAQACPIVF